MAPVLLDTNVLLSLVDVDAGRRLAPEVTTQLADPGTELVVSAVSAWEIAIKTHVGKLPSGSHIVSAWDVTIARLRAEVIDITAADAIMAGGLRWQHGDPFDRMLVAQAARCGLTLVSLDSAVLEGAISTVLDARPARRDPRG